MVATVFATVSMLVACGGGGSKVTTSGLLGEVPAIIGEYENLSAEKKKALMSCDKSAMEGIIKEMKAAEEQMKADLEKAVTSIKGKEVPTEVDAALPLKVVKPLAVEDVLTRNKSVHITGELELTAEAISFDSYEPTDAFELNDLYAVGCDADGKPFSADKLGFSLGGKAMPAGTKKPADTYLDIEGHNAAQMGAISKVIITQKGSELYEQAMAADNALDTSFKAKFEK